MVAASKQDGVELQKKWRLELKDLKFRL